MGTTESKAKTERTPTKKDEPQPQPQRSIVSPCCAAPLVAYGYEANNPQGELLVDGYCCSREGCGNEWNGDGTVLHWISEN